MEQTSRIRGFLALAVLCLIWGSTWSVIQIGLQGIPPLGGVALRFGIASVILLAAALLSGVKLGRTRTERVFWIANGLLAYTITYGIVYWCEQWMPSGLAAVLFATYPFFVAMFSWVLLPAERVNLPEVAGIVIGFSGVGVIFSQDFTALGGRQVAVASAVLLVSPLAAALSTVTVKRWGTGIHPLSLTSIPMALTAGIMGALALLYEGGKTYTWTWSSAGALFYLAIMGSAVTFSIYYWLLARLPAKRLALITYVIPVVAVTIGVLRGERLTARMLAGSAVVLGGVALAMHRRAGGGAGRPRAAE